MKSRWLGLALGLGFALGSVWLAHGPAAVHAGELPATYSGQIAPILYANCATCHHPGGAGPFSLLTYRDARRWGAQVLTVTQSRYMPPWLPEPGHGDFADNRRLSDRDLALIREWVKDGMPSGDLDQAPKPPQYASEWTLGQPDLVLGMDRPFTTPASGSDLFRNFILPYPLATTKYVRAMEILPGTPAAVHHANVVLDPTGSYRRQHPDTWRAGVPGMELVVDAGSTFDPDSHFLFWKPDSPAIVEPPGMEWRLDPGTDLILNMHLKPTGKPETIQARIGLYFSDRPATQHPMLLQLEHDAALDIPAGDRAFAIEDRLTLPVAVKALAVYPHAHYLGKDLKAWAILPDGTRQWLVWIKDWDIDRQSIYRYKSPVLLPKGTVLHMRYVYDNSAANPRNPHTPPVRVKAGNRSEDEMGHLWLQVLPVNPTTDGKDTRLRLEQAWMQARLRKDPDDAMALYNLAAADNEAGQPAEAARLYRRILAHNPLDARTLTALGAALAAKGDAAGAEASYRQALTAKPDDDDARFDLAQVEISQERYAQAEADLRLVLQHAPGDAAALRSLGEVAILNGDLPAAIDRLQAALAIEDDAGTREKLAMAYARSRRLDDAATQLEQAVKLDPGAATAHALLSQVYDGLGRLADAVGEQQAALALDPNDADGWNNLGVLHARGGDKSAARRDFERALKLAPDSATAKANLSRLGEARP